MTLQADVDRLIAGVEAAGFRAVEITPDMLASPVAWDRIRCCIPFCRRTYKRKQEDGGETMCGKHWRLGSPALRRRRTKALRRMGREFDRANALHAAGRPVTECEAAWARGERWARVCDALWDRVKRQAIERSGGI